MSEGRGAEDPLDAIIKINSLEDLKIPAFRTLYELWDQKRGERAMPSRQDFDPSEFTALLPYVALADVEHNPIRIRLRLVGTLVTQVLGYEPTGQYMDLIPGINASLARAYWAIENKTSYFVENMPLLAPHNHYSTYSFLGMLLSDDDELVNITLCIFSFD